MATRELIQRIDVGSGGIGTITFANIPQDGTDLVIVHSTRTNSGPVNPWDPIGIAFNSDFTYTNYVSKNLFGIGNSYGSNGDQNVRAGFASEQSNTANTFSTNVSYIPNYSRNGIKVVSTDGATENNGTLAIICLTASKWSGGSAVTSLSLYAPNGASFQQYSSASLYKVKRGSDGTTGPTATGGTITTSGGYTYHTFTTSGSFQVNKTIAVDVLTVAGGAGGGATRGGGGGAGGYLASSLQLSPQQYPVVIGSGGAGGVGYGNEWGTDGFNGTSSVFGTLHVAIGGGKGAGNNGAPGSGGSGGGAMLWGGSGGAGTAGQGNAGGNSPGYLVSGLGAGGGGAGAVGGNSTSTTIGSGGVGLQWLNGTYYAGGGGGGYDGTGTGTGGTGGNGGGGAGGTSVNTAGNPGTANTGGGGGAGSRNGANGGGYSGGAGGSGVVIVRYLTPA
jgi:hypothetical protein